MNGLTGVIFESVAFIAAISNYFKTKKPVLKWFSLFLLLTNFIEWGNIFRLFSIKHSNNWVANLFNPVEFAFYGWLYFSVIDNNDDRKKIKTVFTLFLFATIINISFGQGFIYFDSYSYIFGCCFLILCVYLYFRQLINSVTEIKILTNPYFWISIGVLFFYTGQAFLMAFFQYFLYIKDFESFRSVFFFFNNLLNAILYSCLSISFFCNPKQLNI